MHKVDWKYGYVPTMQEINSLKKEFKVISTFSGIGCSSTGYKMAGLDVIASVEFVDFQARNYRANHPGTKVYEGDIRQLDPLKILSDFNLKPGELDLLDGSPPCASFSTMGKREKAWGQVKNYSNRKQRVDDLFFEFARFLTVMQPKVFVAENVKGLVIGKAKGYFLEILRALKACGYNVKAKVINAKYYGVPQSRERLIFIGVRNDLNIEPVYPEPCLKIITLKKALEDIKNDDTLYSRLSENMTKIWNETVYGSSFEKAYKKYRGKTGMFSHIRCSYHKPVNTVVQGSQSLYHPEEPRTLTIKELKRVSSLPEDFILKGSFSQQWEGCGRGVPPLLMYAVAKTIKENILYKIG